MQIIYQPKGPAGEYSPLAANLYEGCVHGCSYCYVPGMLRRKKPDFHTQAKPRPNVLDRLENDAKKLEDDNQEILLSFTSDPYQPLEEELGITRKAIQILIKNDLRFTVLTKSGHVVLRDFDLFSEYEKCRIGFTLVFISQTVSEKWEPHPQITIDARIDALKTAHELGIRTWVSMEPVIEPDQALKLIRVLYPYVDHWKVGKLNYHSHAKSVDWLKFKHDVVELLDSLGADYYIKRSLSEL